jgi:hypothetical protein
MMNDELIAALDDCLNAMASGVSLEASLSRYPALADELRPLLEAARMAGGPVAVVPPQAQMASRAQFLARAAQPRPRPAQLGSARWGVRALTTAFVILLGLLVGAYGAVAASADSLPGEALYPIKRTVEQTQLLFASNPEVRAQLEAEFETRRWQEAQAITNQKRQAQVEFQGRIEGIWDERWSVAGIVVIVTDETRVTGYPAPGQVAQVFGQSQTDGTVLASEITVITSDSTPTPTATVSSPTLTLIPTQTARPLPTLRASPTSEQLAEIEFTGVVESISMSVWRISGQVVNVNSETDLRNNPQVGQTVEVRAVRGTDGTLIARRIEARISSSGPSPSNTPEPTQSSGSSGPLPSNTPQPQNTQSSGSGGESGPSPSNTPDPEEVRFEGTLESINGNTWTVAGQAVTVTGSTEIKDNPQVGDRVKVRAYRQPDGSLVATRIEKDNSGPGS